MAGIVSFGAYIPYNRLDRKLIGKNMEVQCQRGKSGSHFDEVADHGSGCSPGLCSGF